MRVVFHPAAAGERAAIDPQERVAVDNVIEKLGAIGLALGAPHSSAVRGGSKLRELRPRAGRSRTRVFYGRVGDTFVIAAIGPEAKVDPRGFKRALAAAQDRLAEVAPGSKSRARQPQASGQKKSRR